MADRIKQASSSNRNIEDSRKEERKMQGRQTQLVVDLRVLQGT